MFDYFHKVELLYRLEYIENKKGNDVTMQIIGFALRERERDPLSFVARKTCLQVTDRVCQ